jgi:hypothetical protein
VAVFAGEDGGTRRVHVRDPGQPWIDAAEDTGIVAPGGYLPSFLAIAIQTSTGVNWPCNTWGGLTPDKSGVEIG